MPVSTQGKLITDLAYDATRSRHYVNGVDTVLHCHHYVSLYTQMADDATLFDGRTILRNTAAHTFAGVLRDYVTKYGVNTRQARAAAIEEYWSFCGMGSLHLVEVRDNGGSAEMTASHVDEGWIKKFGRRKEPVNYITQGYLAAAFSVLTDTPESAWQVKETQSIVSGAEKSVFSITRS